MNDLTVFSYVMMLFVMFIVSVETLSLLRAIEFSGKSKYKGWTRVRYTWMRYTWSSFVLHEVFAWRYKALPAWRIIEPLLFTAALAIVAYYLKQFEGEPMALVEAVGGALTITGGWFMVEYGKNFVLYRRILERHQQAGTWKTLRPVIRVAGNPKWWVADDNND